MVEGMVRFTKQGRKGVMVVNFLHCTHGTRGDENITQDQCINRKLLR